MRKFFGILIILGSLLTACNLARYIEEPSIKAIGSSISDEKNPLDMEKGDTSNGLTDATVTLLPDEIFPSLTPIPTRTQSGETETPTLTATPGSSPTTTLTTTITITPTTTSTATSTSTPTITVTPTVTQYSYVSATPTTTAQPTATKTNTPVATATQTATSTNIPVSTATSTPTVVPSTTPTATTEVPPPPTNTPLPPSCSASVNTSFESQVVALINQERANAGVAPLTVDSRLTYAARVHSQDMACNGFFSHTSPTTGTAFDRILAAGYTYSWAGENIIAGYSSAASSVAWWMASTPHRNNILNPNFVNIGVGHAYDSESTYGTYGTSVFGAP